GHARRARPGQAHHAVDELGARRAEAEVAAQLYGDAGRVGRDQIADLPDAPAAESRPEDAWLALTRTEVSFRIGHHLGGAAGDRERVHQELSDEVVGARGTFDRRALGAEAAGAGPPR